jgi:VCBS repeat-containing protein
MPGRVPAHAATDKGRRRLRGRARALLVGAGLLAFGGLATVVAQAITPPAYAATATLTPSLYYIGDSAGSVYTFTVTNTGTTSRIGAVEIDRPDTWTITSCPTAPSGWAVQAASTKCRYRSADTAADDIAPGQSRTFGVKARTDAGGNDRTGTWVVVVSKSNQFDNPSLLKNATPAGPGLGTKLYTYEVTGAVVVPAGVKVPGTACPAANKSAVIGSTPTIVVCGKDHASINLTPTASRSTLGGTYVTTPGTFSSGPIVHNSGNVVLANWASTHINGTYGNDYKVIAGIGSASNRTSPLRTFTGYSSTSQPPVANNDTYSTDEDTTLNVALPGVLGNDTDAESDPITASLVTDVSHGTLTLNANGSFDYVPNADYHGPDSFTYKANDGHSDSAAATVSITVNSVNDAPVAADLTPSTNEDTAKTVTLSASDVDGDALAFSVVTGPSHGSLGLIGLPACASNTCTADVTYTPDGNYNGPDSFTYKANDGGADSNTATVSLTVVAVNDAPVANPDSYSTDEDTALNVTAPGVLGNDTDVEGDPLTAVLDTGVTHGTLTLNGDGSFDYTPDADYNGPDSFSYKANDGTADSAGAVTAVTINPVNDAPTATAFSASTNEDTAKPLTLTGHDVDGDALTFSVGTGPAHGSLGSVGTPSCGGTTCTASVTYTPDANYTGPDSFTYRVNDGSADSSYVTVSLTVDPVDDAPVANGDSYSTNEDTALNVPASGVLGNDSDVESDPLTAVLDTGVAHGTLTLNSDGSFDYTPDADYNGPDSFTYHANDGTLDSNVATVAITVDPVNDAPAPTALFGSTNEDTAKVFTLTADDVDGDALTFSIVTGPLHGSLGAIGTPSCGAMTCTATVTYTPDANYNGPDSFSYKANDGALDSATAPVNVTVNAVNDAPVANDDSSNTNEDTALNVPASGVLGNDSDVESDPLTAVLDTDVTHGTLTLNPDGSFTYTPDANYHGPDSFTYHANDGALDSNVATVTITVNAVNDAPTAAGNSVATDEDTAKVVTLSGNDVDGDALTFSVVTGPAHGSLGSIAAPSCLTGSCTADVTYTPDANYHGPDSFTFKVNDGSADSAPATVNVTVNSVNDPPVATNDSYSTNEDTQLVVAAPGVLGNDSDVDSDPLTTVLGTGVTHGTLTLNPDGSFTYTPDANYYGSDSFAYKANDGTANSNEATVTLTVNSVNDDPVADNGSDTTNEDATKQVALSGSDPVEGSALTFSIVTGPAHGSLGSIIGTTCTTGCTASVAYSPDADYFGSDSFTYKVNDGTNDSPPATVSLTVTSINDAPFFTAGPDDTVVQDTGARTVAGWATGMAAGPANESGQTFAFTVTATDTSLFSAQPAVDATTGDLTYTPASGVTGSTLVTVTLHDNGGTANGGVDTSPPQTFTINIVPPNATPVAAATSASGNEDGGAITVNLSGTDADGNALTFIAGTATNGTVGTPTGPVCNGLTPRTCTSTVTYTPNANFFGADSFTYRVNDGTINSAPATASITVNPVNDVPSFTKGADQTVNEDAGAQTVTGWATAISVGPANESGQVVSFIVTDNNNALFSSAPSVNGAGDLTYTPAVNANGVATVTVKAHDDGGTANGGADTSAGQTFTITVNVVNDAPSFTKGADQTLFEDGGSQSVSGWATAISKGPSDESAQTLSFTVGNDNNALFSGQPAVSPTGTLTYTPAANAVGSATVTLSLSDNGGTANGGVNTSAPQTFTITVNPVNDAPSFTTAGNQTVLEDAGAQAVNGFVTSTSAGPPDESQTVTVSVTGNNNPSLFSAQPAIDSAGTLTYTPAANANGAATVTVHATDNGGTANGGVDTSGNQTFTITVTAVNDAPSFTKGADQTLLEDAGSQSVSGWATGISPGPNEPTQTVSFTVTNDNNGIFAVQPAVSPTGTLTYTGAANKYGLATVSVKIVDNGGTANGGVDTSATQTFTITITPVNDAPVAAAKAFTAQANMKISLGGLLVGATDPNDVAGDPSWTPSFTLGTITVGAGCTGCTVSNVNTTNGTFDFDPPAGGSGPYTVTYTVVDNGFPAPGATSAPATITFTVNGPVIWFVDTAAAGGGTGRLSAPFNTLAGATTAMSTHTNERIFVTGGNVTGNVVLQTDGWLISEAATGTSFDTVMNITPPAGTIARPSVNGTQRTLTGSVTVGTNSVVRGFDLTPGSGTPGLVGASKSNLTVNQMSITTTNADAVNVTNSQGSTITLKKVSSTGAASGITMTNVNNTTPGSFTVTGDGSTANSGGIITTSSGDGIHLDTVSGVSLAWMTVSNGTANGIFGSTVAGFTLAHSSITGNGTNAGLDHDGVHFANLSGTVSVTTTTVSGSKEDNFRITNTAGTLGLTLTGNTFANNDPTVGANGVLVDAQGTSTATVTVNTNTFTNNNTDGLALFGQSSNPFNATVGTNTFNGNMVGVDVESNGTGAATFSVVGVTVDNRTPSGNACSPCGAPINAYKGTGATSGPMAVTFKNNVVNNNNSALAYGIWVHGEGATGALRATVQNNNVRGVQSIGIYGAPGNGNSSLDIDISNNDVDVSAAGAQALYGIYVENGTLNTDVNATCANIKSNKSVSASGFEGIFVSNNFNGSYRLPGFPGGTDTVAAAFVATGNTAPTTAGAFSSSGHPFTGGAACTTP